MDEKHKRGKDGVLKDGVSHYTADARDLESYQDARQQLSRLKAPVLLRAQDSNERLFVACFDGTGNDANNDPAHTSGVARIHDLIAELNEGRDAPVHAGYVEGPGTQKNIFTRTRDGARGHTYDERLEEMYRQFINQAREWRDSDPSAQIRIANIGFSRGAEQAAGFARLVHERGVQDPSGAVYSRNRKGEITGVTYTKPPLVAPGETAQAVGLFDPVGTGEPIKKHDRRLPPSVVSAFQITSEDERRWHFRSSPIIDLGFSEDGRFLNVMVAGAHSDIGDTYHRNGLGIRSGNLMVDYLNALSDTPFLRKRAEPDDPRLNVVHRSEEGMLLYRLWPKVDRREPEGVNERLVPKGRLKHEDDCCNPEPRDEALAAQFEFRPVPIGPVPPSPAQATHTQVDINDPATLVDRLLTAAAIGDNTAFRDATRAAANHSAARELREHAVATVDQQQAAAQQQAAQQQDAQQHGTSVRRHTVPMH